MDKMDIADELIRRGVDEKAAERFKGEVNGNDLMNLVQAFKNTSRPYQGQVEAEKLLGKYGIKLGRTTMSDDYLNAKFESLRSGETLDETFGCMTKLDEGFSYSVEVSEQTRDRVLDWLDENQVEYQATSPVAYRIECGDRNVAYRTGRALSEILRKQTVRDSVEIEEKMSKKPEKRAKDAKKKIELMKPRNPVIAAVKTRSGAGAHDGGKDPRKVDKFGRGAKHKPRFDEEIEFEIGEDVMVGEAVGQIKIPHGPNGTIGVIMNGQLEMVAESEVSRLDEGVIGMMKPVNPLFRLRELAGLPLENDDFAGIEVVEAPEIDPEGVLAAGPVGDKIVDMELDGIGADPVEEPMADMDGGMEEPEDLSFDVPVDDVETTGTLDLPADAGIPGAVGSDPVMTVGNVPSQSEAMAQIEDALNSIQAGLADIRLSEYKSLIQKLQDLTNQAQMMGRDYLGERRKK
jgi:hypothetical protein